MSSGNKAVTGTHTVFLVPQSTTSEQTQTFSEKYTHIPNKKMNSTGSKSRNSRTRRAIQGQIPATVLVGQTRVAQTSPLPLEFTCPMIYSDVYTIASGTLGIAGTQQEMLVNSTYDPDSSGTGHQPYGRDTLAALYFRYQVLSVAWELEVMPKDVSAKYLVAVLMQATGGGYSMTSALPSALMEKPGVNSMVVPDVAVAPLRFSGRVDCWKMFGLTRDQYVNNVTEFGAVAGSNPNKGLYLNFTVADLLGSTGKAVVFALKLKQTVRWFDPIIQAQS